MKFRFSAPDVDFSCVLTSTRCESVTKQDTRCARHACIGTRYCWTHLLRDKKLRVKPSEIAGAGKGLFAMDLDEIATKVVFGRGDIIIDYDGEPLKKADIDARYGAHTAPYAIRGSRDKYEDGACHRGLGAILNHSPHPNYTFVAKKNGRVQIAALKNIRNHTELCADYGDEYVFGDGATHRTSG